MTERKFHALEDGLSGVLGMLGKLYPAVLSVLLATLVTCLSASAQEGPWGDPYDALLERPDVTVVYSTEDDGRKVRKFLTPGGVEIRQSRLNGNIDTFTSDTSKNGAVVCAWWIVLSLRASMDACPKLGNDELKSDFDRAIARINRFIHKNALEPTSLEQVETDAVKYRARTYNSSQSPEDRERICRNPDRARLITVITEGPPNGFNGWVDNLLAVPRLPVANPCL